MAVHTELGTVGDHHRLFKH